MHRRTADVLCGLIVGVVGLTAGGSGDGDKASVGTTLLAAPGKQVLAELTE